MLSQGLIKANMPSRIAFASIFRCDSRTYYGEWSRKASWKRRYALLSDHYPKPVRVQGSFVSDKSSAGCRLPDQSEWQGKL